MLVVRPHTVFKHAWILVQPLKKIFSPSYSLRSRIAKCRDLWFFFFRITPLLPWVHSNESENFIPPLMLRTFELTINNTCFDWPFERRSQFQNEGMGTNDHHFEIIWEDTTIANLNSLSWDNYKKCVCLELDDGMDVDLWFIYMHFYKFGIHTCWIWMFICLF